MLGGKRHCKIIPTLNVLNNFCSAWRRRRLGGATLLRRRRRRCCGLHTVPRRRVWYLFFCCCVWLVVCAFVCRRCRTEYKVHNVLAMEMSSHLYFTRVSCAADTATSHTHTHTTDYVEVVWEGLPPPPLLPPKGRTPPTTMTFSYLCVPFVGMRTKLLAIYNAQSV